MSRPKTIAHAELAILDYLINGDGATMANGGLAKIAERMQAVPCEAPGESKACREKTPCKNCVAHNRFIKAADNVGEQMNRLLEQRKRKVGDA